ncbi:MAG: type I-F CRISPR-associated protein Csy3 [Methyloprofundus sp.]|nr:type I-F CRISPR-associated protein Csy3 [Methyloprofundus sp.]MBW6453088.1 type I-F CRISPR-associated protein Csy3 [Methyloprofundus sp.]
MSKTIELPSLLAFDRKLETSDALMFAGNWQNIGNDDATWRKIAITKRYNRSTQSAYGIDDAKKSEPNPVASDSDDANLPHDNDTLKVMFSTRIIGNIGLPFACNEPSFEELLSNKVNEFKEQDKLETLAYRYAYNIANGRFLWRNRVCAESVKIEVYQGEEDEPLKFDAHAFSLQNFDKNNVDSDLVKLTKIIQSGLNAQDDFTLLKVIAYVKLGNGQHVFPSQEMNMGEKGKVLFQLDGCAAVHNVKIGNALRTIDNWYTDNAEFPIAAEPYGAVTQRGQAYRKSENDLYTLIKNWLNEKEITSDDKNFIVANLIRGGLFQGDSKKKKG